jgi:tRNA pseudouridine55 synthase
LGRRRKGRNVHGIFLLDKPAGYSSNQALQQVRHLYQARKAGHTGSLDPFATGMLPVCLGEASKTAGHMLDSAKTYRACARLGLATDTADTEGKIIREMKVPNLDSVSIESVFREFTGVIEQIPPMYSALKHQGKRLYQMAREGKEVERPPRRVTILNLELISWNSPDLWFEVHCSKGTYIRTLAEDLAEALGTCAHLTSLRRTAIDSFAAHDCITLETLKEAVVSGTRDSLLLPLDAGLSDWPVVEVSPEQERKVKHGNPVTVDASALPHVRIVNQEGDRLGLGAVSESGELKPQRLFVFDP